MRIARIADSELSAATQCHALLPPGTSIGYHRHQAIEETYVIINGSGRIRRSGPISHRIGQMR